MSTGSVVTCRPRATRSWKKMGCVSSSGVDAAAPLLWPHMHFLPLLPDPWQEHFLLRGTAAFSHVRGK